MAYDPCNPVPDNNIPAGYTPARHHAPHHVVGRIQHHIRHKFVHLGPPAHAPIPDGCEKHAITGPGYGHGGPAAPISKAAALGGAGAGLVALGGLGGLVGGLVPGIKKTIAKTTITGPGPVTVTPGTGTNPTPPIVPIVPPTPPTIFPPPPVPVTPPTTVPEPSAIAMFLVGAAVVMLARYLSQRRLAKVRVRAG